jgi:endonuclease IV
MQNVAAFHCNDSKAALGSGRDLHENIGEGYIGRAGFEALLARREIQDIPLLLEVPGYKIDGAGKGPDKPNIDLMKEIRAGATSGGSKSPPAASAKAKSPAAKKKA